MAEMALHREKLLELLGAQHESDRLDYKRTIDLSDKRAELEFIKDIAAFQAEGGYLVVGVDGAGVPTGELTDEQAEILDESRLRAKALRYLVEPLDLRTAVHVVEGARVALIHVGPHPDGIAIVVADGVAEGKVVLRKGDVFVRHGTASERWTHNDLVRLKERIVKAARGVPELVPAPALEHRAEDPHVVKLSPAGGLRYQRIIIFVKNVGNEIARVTKAVVNTNGPATLRPASAIPPGGAEPFEINALVADEGGVPAGTEFMLRITYEGGGRRRELLTNVRYYRSGGFENLGADIWEA
jgi:hypothetical protein